MVTLSNKLIKPFKIYFDSLYAAIKSFQYNLTTAKVAMQGREFLDKLSTECKTSVLGLSALEASQGTVTKWPGRSTLHMTWANRFPRQIYLLRRAFTRANIRWQSKTTCSVTRPIWSLIVVNRTKSYSTWTGAP